MATQRELVDTILAELVIAQGPEFIASPRGEGFWLPPTLPVGDGQFLAASDHMIDAIGRFAEIVMDNDHDVARSYPMSRRL